MSKTKPTIYEVLKEKLGREPTNEELKQDCLRIIREANEESRAKGKKNEIHSINRDETNRKACKI